MTEKEAISYLEIEKISAEETSVGKIKIQMCEEAIKALRDVQEYREIGTVEQVKNQKHNLSLAYKIIRSENNTTILLEEARKAMQKQKPKKPEFLHMLGNQTAKYRCQCGNVFAHACPGFPYADMMYCDRCGQKLDWEG